MLFAEQCAPARREEKKGREGKEKEKKNTQKVRNCNSTVFANGNTRRCACTAGCQITIYVDTLSTLPRRLAAPWMGGVRPPPPSQCPVACIPTYLHTYIHT